MGSMAMIARTSSSALGVRDEYGGPDAVQEGATGGFRAALLDVEVGEVLDRAGEVGVEGGVACAARTGPLRVKVGLWPESGIGRGGPWEHSRQRLTFFSQSWSWDLSCEAVREWSEQPSAPDKSPWEENCCYGDTKEPQLERLATTTLLSEAE